MSGTAVEVSFAATVPATIPLSPTFGDAAMLKLAEPSTSFAVNVSVAATAPAPDMSIGAPWRVSNTVPGSLTEPFTSPMPLAVLYSTLLLS
ncbi:MAG: hypothetical protein LBT26_01015 [Clostridiales Family XIII bacterium]|nr:hypothetical protein [Clostridiales Family XIII bacterium]